MFSFTFGLAITGILMSKGIGDEFFEEIHELCAVGFIVIVVLHIAGIVFHQTKHKDGLFFSMISGTKDDIEGELEIRSNHPVVALVFIGLIVAFGLFLNQNYDSNTQKLHLFGTYIELSEDGHGNSKKKEHSHHDFEEDEDEDDE